MSWAVITPSHAGSIRSCPGRMDFAARMTTAVRFTAASTASSTCIEISAEAAGIRCAAATKLVEGDPALREALAGSERKR